MNRRNKRVILFVLLAAAILLLTSCSAGATETAKKRRNTATPAVTETPAPEAEGTEEPGPLDEAQKLVNHLSAYGELPDNFLTKKEAKELGWQDKYRYVSDAAPGMSIGGDYFGNYERKLPAVKGRKYYEADCFYQGGPRNEYRLIWSNDGQYWFTEDHYNTFTELYPTP